MFPLAHRREGVVEAHRNVANEQAAGVGHFQAAGVRRTRPSASSGASRREFRREVFREIDAEFLRHRGVIKRQVAHARA